MWRAIYTRPWGSAEATQFVAKQTRGRWGGTEFGKDIDLRLLNLSWSNNRMIVVTTPCSDASVVLLSDTLEEARCKVVSGDDALSRLGLTVVFRVSMPHYCAHERHCPQSYCSGVSGQYSVESCFPWYDIEFIRSAAPVLDPCCVAPNGINAQRSSPSKPQNMRQAGSRNR